MNVARSAADLHRLKLQFVKSRIQLSRQPRLVFDALEEHKFQEACFRRRWPRIICRPMAVTCGISDPLAFAEKSLCPGGESDHPRAGRNRKGLESHVRRRSASNVACRGSSQ